MYNHELEWLNADRSLNESLFYSDNLHLIKEGNEILAQEIVAFYKYLKSHNCPTDHKKRSIVLSKEF